MEKNAHDTLIMNNICIGFLLVDQILNGDRQLGGKLIQSVIRGSQIRA